MPLDKSIQKVLVIGSGPIVIGQAAEFDYAGAQACRVLKDAGINVVLCNSNPATIMTDKDIADHVYIEPLNLASVEQVIAKERPDSILPTLGGQTGLNLAMNLHEQGILEKYGVRLLGTSPESIRKAEDRQGFKDAMEAIGQPCVTSDVVESVEAAVEFAGRIGYPVMLKAISEAKERVFLSSFIFGYDEVGKSFAAALRAAAERGCDVRLLMDGVGSFHLWPSWRKRLGPDVKLAYFLPPRLIPPQFSINLRTHRKVLICDSETGFTGGMNISQNHLANLKRRSRVQDVHFRCFGPIA